MALQIHPVVEESNNFYLFFVYDSKKNYMFSYFVREKFTMNS